MVLSGFERANGASVTLELLSKIPSASARAVASTALIHAAIELLLATRWKGTKRAKFDEKSAFVLWKFKGVSYAFQPLVDDSIFDTYESVRRRGAIIFLIVPSNYDRLVRNAFEHTYGRAQFYVSAIEDHMSWRIMWATLDEGWSHEKTILWWLQRYNAFLAKRNASSTLQVEVPSECPVT